MKKYRFVRRDGKAEESSGYDVVDAFRRLGYGGWTIRALDYWEDQTESS